jgi:hypothetical protein
MLLYEMRNCAAAHTAVGPNEQDFVDAFNTQMLSLTHSG